MERFPVLDPDTPAARGDRAAPRGAGRLPIHSRRMDVVSECPLRVASMVWRPGPGAWALTVVCKATYVLAPGTAPPSNSQDEPSPRDVHAGDDERQSLVQPCDLAPFKRRCDVVLVGHAYAPDARPVTSLRARLAVAEIDKTIAIHGDRAFTLDSLLTEPARFTSAELRWERAAGGPGTSNPVGMRPDAPPDARGSITVPNLTPPDIHVARRGDAIPPVGFGPIAPTWPGRRGKLHHRAATWDHRRWNEAPLPDDIDTGYFNVALEDQQVAELHPDERIVLENLHPSHPQLATRLEPLSPRALADTGAGPTQEVRLRCDTLLIDTDRRVATLTWRGNLPLHHPAQPGRVVVTLERRSPRAADAPAPGMAHAPTHGMAPAPAPTATSAQAPSQEHGAPPAARPKAVTAPMKLVSTGELDPAMSRATGLPFTRNPAPGAAPAAPPAPPLPQGPRVVAAPPELGGTGRLDPAMIRAAGAVLPFREGASRTGTAARSNTHVSAPPQPPGPEAPPVPAPSPVLAQPPVPVPAPAPVPAPPPAPVHTPSYLHAPAPLYTPVYAPSYLHAPRRAPEVVQPPVPAPVTTPAAIPATALDSVPAPSPVANPVPTPGSVPIPSLAREPGSSSVPAAASAHAAVSAPAHASPASASESVSAPAPAERELPLGEYPLQRCAALTASIARRKAEQEAILERSRLTPEIWEALSRHWTEAVQRDMERGKTELLAAYDDAYVGQLEAERGPIEVEEYARLSVASERGMEKQTLTELDLPRAALLRIRRVWLRRTSRDPALARRLRKAIDDAE